MLRPAYDELNGARMLMLSEIAKAVGGQLIGLDVVCESVGSDSRNIAKNQLFVAIKGERFDGNAYAAEAIKQGAAAALVSDANTHASPAVLVADTRLALGQLAKYWRATLPLPRDSSRLVSMSSSTAAPIPRRSPCAWMPARPRASRARASP